MIVGDIQYILQIVRSFHQKQISHIPGKIIDKLPHLFSLVDQLLQDMNASGHILTDYFSEELAEHFIIHRSKHFQYLVISQFLTEIKSNALIQQA